jgi:hypothetical protein
LDETIALQKAHEPARSILRKETRAAPPVDHMNRLPSSASESEYPTDNFIAQLDVALRRRYGGFSPRLVGGAPADLAESLIKAGMPSRGDMIDAAMAGPAAGVLSYKGPMWARRSARRMAEHKFRQTPRPRALHSC